MFPLISYSKYEGSVESKNTQVSTDVCEGHAHYLEKHTNGSSEEACQTENEKGQNLKLNYLSMNERFQAHGCLFCYSESWQ